MLALMAAALLVFTDPARPVTGVVRDSFLYGESSPGVCRGTLKTYQFDTVARKWETVEDPEDLFA